jgi:formiminotetrahydrofolate cyclodeaminase
VTSVWLTTLGAFSDEVATPSPVPAAVAVSAVTAQLGLGLLIKVLEITAKRKGFSGDSLKVRALIDAAHQESEQLRAVADEDIAAVRQFLSFRNSSAVRNAIEVPMRAARAGVAGLDLCGEAAGIIHGLLAADLGAGVLLLSAGVRAILISVDSNLRQFSSEEGYREQVIAERRVLEDRCAHQAGTVLAQVSKGD